MNHNHELARRYLGIDYVAEFQRHWSYLNRWFRIEFSTNTDRDGVEQLKTDVRVERAISILRDQGHSPLIQGRISGNDNRHGDVDIYRYSTPTPLSAFVTACFDADPIAAAINLFNPANENQVRGTATIALEPGPFIDLYRSVTAPSDRFMDQPMMSVEEALSMKQISFSGAMFYRDPIVGPLPADRRPYAEACWQSITSNPALTELADLGRSSIGIGLHHDILEMVYIVRNAAVHGDLDFLAPSHNEVARTALTVLDGLVLRLTPERASPSPPLLGRSADRQMWSSTSRR